MSETFKVTVREVYEAIEKNGFEWLRGSWFSPDWQFDEPITGGCVLGQAALNLKAFAMNEDAGGDNQPADSLLGQLNKFPMTPGKWYPEDKYAPMRTLAGQIMFWNDRTELSPENEWVYTLKTYEEVVQMAYDCLSPHFDEVLELTKYEYNI